MQRRRLARRRRSKERARASRSGGVREQSERVGVGSNAMSPVLDRAHVHADKLGDVGPADTVSEEHERLCAPRDTLFESALPKQRLAVGALCGRERERGRLARG